MPNLLLTYLITIVVLIALDAIWLGVVAQKFYQTQLKELLRKKFDLKPAALFYLIYAAGLIQLAIWPAYLQTHVFTATLHGAWLGLCAYGAYNFTNAATLKKWPVSMVLVDLTWGTLMSSLVATFIAYLLLNWPL